MGKNLPLETGQDKEVLKRLNASHYNIVSEVMF